MCVLKATGLYIFKWLMLCYVNFPSLQKQTTVLIILQAHSELGKRLPPWELPGVITKAAIGSEPSPAHSRCLPPVRSCLFPTHPLMWKWGGTISGVSVCMLGSAGVYTYSLNVKLRLGVSPQGHTQVGAGGCVLQAQKEEIGKPSGLGVGSATPKPPGTVPRLSDPRWVCGSNTSRAGGVQRRECWVPVGDSRLPEGFSTPIFSLPPQSTVVRGGPGSQHHLQQDSWPGPTAACHLPEPTRCHHCDRGGGADGHQ